MKALILCDSKSNIEKVYGNETLVRIGSECVLYENILSGSEIAGNNNITCDADVIFSTWGMPQLKPEQIDEYFPKLKAVFYGAGSVQQFAKPFLDKGIKVFSAWAANAVPVAEYTVSQIILANKGFFSCRIKDDYEAAKTSFAVYPGNYGARIGLLGLGMVGRAVAERLKAYNLSVLYYDPYFNRENAAGLGVKESTLKEIFKTCGVISNHIANLPSTQGMLGYDLFSLMTDNAVFINTGRGAQVVEEDLVRAMKEKPGRCALLDVTYPEPPEKGHEFYTTKNIWLTPHIAGSAGDECRRMGVYMAEEFERFAGNKETKWEVSIKMLSTMA